MTLPYRVHLHSRGPISCRFDEATPANQWVTNSPEVVAEFETLEGAIDHAYSFLGRDPSDTAIVSSADGRVCEQLRCDQYGVERSRDSNRLGIALGLLLLCCVAFIISVVSDASLQGFTIFVLSSIAFTFISSTQKFGDSLVVAFLVQALLFLVLL